MNPCFTCKHFEGPGANCYGYSCRHPATLETDPVWGDTYGEDPEDMRASGGVCGPSARLWEPRWWARLKGRIACFFGGGHNYFFDAPRHWRCQRCWKQVEDCPPWYF